jgi:hypothetical protein
VVDYLKDALDWLRSEKLTAPAKATLLLALAQPRFEEHGWGIKKVKELLP